VDREFEDAASFVGVAESLRWWVGIVVVTSLILVGGDLMGACSHQMHLGRKSGGRRGCCSLSGIA
jgi:hypothetical protein